ncbi:MAG: C-GCAxxG-C-C family protein [bacterium]
MESKAVDRGIELFQSGKNCSEAVFQAVSEFYGEENIRINLLTPLGGGFGSGGTCGALSGAIVALGIKYGRETTNSRKKEKAYKEAEKVYTAFREKFGDVNCSELKGEDSATKYNCEDYVKEAINLAVSSLNN